MLLKQQDVLILDCQATAANPETGHLLEIGWVRMQAVQPLSEVEAAIQSYIVQLPAEISVPRQVSRITGLKTSDCENGLPVVEIWQELMAGVAGFGGICPTVIHFARYEEAFLRFLHQQYGRGETFPFEIICTHELARRLLPSLPGKGLRAIAGYLGHGTPELRRSAHHMAATALVWQHFVGMLEIQGIERFQHVQQWLNVPLVASGNSAKQFPMNPALRANLPDSPGVYRMLRADGDILYVGKATSLKKRVQSYFHKKKASTRSRLTMEMLSQAVGLEVTVTGSALEAALLETDWIKHYSPPYNVALRSRDREIAFFSSDLSRCSPHAGEGYPLGPLPSVRSFSSFAALHALLKEERVADEPAELLGILPEYAPEVDCFAEGVRLFQQIHHEILEPCRATPHGMLPALMGLGKRLHLQKLEEMAQARLEKATPAVVEDPEESMVEDEENLTQRVWTPEGVVHVLEGITRFGAHVLRRSRWFCLLSESVLVWESGETAGYQPRLVVLQAGVPVGQENWEVGKSLPVPPGYKKSFPDRQVSFDVNTYDRMRVLTTELRRLVTSPTDRHLQLCLGPGIILQKPSLLQLFRWV